MTRVEAVPASDAAVASISRHTLHPHAALVYRGADVDQPRNLAKSVTVE